MKTCSVCEQDKPDSEYYIQVGKPMKRCKECQRSYARAWAVLNKVKMLETRAKYKGSAYRTKVSKGLANVNGTT